MTATLVVAVLPTEADAAVGTQTVLSISPDDHLAAVTCPTSTLCYAVGNHSSNGTSNGILALIANGSILSIDAAGGNTLSGIACTSATTCTAVGSSNGEGTVVPITDGKPGAVIPVAHTAALYGVACATSTACYAAGTDYEPVNYSTPSHGLVVSITSGVPGAPTIVSNTNSVNGIDCRTATRCQSIGMAFSDLCGIYGGCPPLAVVTPIVDGVPQPQPSDLSGYNTDGTAISCASSTACTAVGAFENGSAFVGETDTEGTVIPVRADGSVDVSKIDNPGTELLGVSCPIVSYCVAVGDQFDGSTNVPQIAQIVDNTVRTRARSSVALDGVACPSITSCIAVGDAVVLITNSTLPTTTALTSTPDPTAGAPTTLTATVTAPTGTPTATGTVTFTDTTTGTTLGTSGLADGVATLTTSTLGAGSHDLSAAYSGSTTEDPSSGTVSISVSKGQAGMTLTPSANPTSYGKDLTFTATLTGPAGLPAPTGTVTFTDNQSQLSLGTVPLNASGTAIVTTSALAVGQRAVTAVYSGDADFQPDSAVVTETVSTGPVGVVVESGSYNLNGVGCEAAGECIAVGYALDASHTALAGVLVHQDGDRIGAPAPVSGTANLKAIACASATLCFAVGNDSAGTEGVVVPISNDSPSAPVTVPGTARLDGVTCSSASGCLAVGYDGEGNGMIVPITLSGPGTPRSVGAAVLLEGVACQSDTSCVAVGQDVAAHRGAVVGIASGSPGPVHDVSGTGSLNGVSCANSTSCTAVGQDDQSTVGVLVPVGLGTIGAVATDPGTVDLYGVACATATSCVAAGQRAGELEGAVAAFGSGRGFTNTFLAGSYDLSGIACDTSTSCLAAGQNVGQGVLDPLTLGGVTLLESLKKSTTTLTSSTDPSSYGRPVTLTATVTPSDGATPTGTVTFTDTTTGVALGTATLDAGGAAHVTTAALGIGSHTITAAYSGDANNNPGSGSLTQTVNKAATTLAAVAATVTTHVFSATLSRSDNGAPVAGQSITFTTKSLLGTADVVCTAITGSNGIATCTHSVPLGDLLDTTYTATYPGGSTYLGATTTAKLSL